MRKPGGVSRHLAAIEFNPTVLDDIRSHAQRSMDKEICGVLIGNVVNDIAQVEASIAGENAEQADAHVTFTHEAWDHIYRIKDDKYSESSIVGWYHSHPGFGIFLSDYDLFIHENFFSAQHQVALVVDPHSNDEGCFGWISGEVQRVTYFPERASQGAVSGITKPSTSASSDTQPLVQAPRGADESLVFRTLIALGIFLILMSLLFIRGNCSQVGRNESTSLPAKESVKKRIPQSPRKNNPSERN